MWGCSADDESFPIGEMAVGGMRACTDYFACAMINCLVTCEAVAVAGIELTIAVDVLAIDEMNETEEVHSEVDVIQVHSGRWAEDDSTETVALETNSNRAVTGDCWA